MIASLKPKHIRQGDTVALVAPAFSFDPSRMEKGRAHLEKTYGIRTIWLESLFDRESYFAGSDERRAQELEHWLTDDRVSALLGVRGGYGCTRIYLDVLKRLKKHRRLKPKIVAGYSDLTVFLNGLHQDLGWITFHAPVVTGSPLHSPLPIEADTFSRALFSAEPLGVITDAATTTLLPGKGRGPIVGGCLSLLISSLGTDYEVDTAGKILFVEDIDERPYRLDRMATQLLHAGKLDKIKGLIIGQLPHCEPPAADKDPSQTTGITALRSAIEPFLNERGIPMICDFPAGHGKPQITFPIGAEVELRAPADGGRPVVEFLEAGACS